MTRPRVIALQHESVATLGWLGDVLAERGVDTEVRDIRGGDPLPGLGEFDVLISLGGDLSAYDEATFGWLRQEKALIGDAVQAGVPILGICLGGQLVADATGGRTHRAAEPELGFLQLQLTNEGREDAVLRHLDSPVLLWHGDTFDMPPGAQLLATSDRFAQAFRIGSALGLQFHPETSPEMLRTWVSAIGRHPVEGPTDGSDAEGSTRFDALVPDAERLQTRLRDCTRRMFSAWANEAGL